MTTRAAAVLALLLVAGCAGGTQRAPEPEDVLPLATPAGPGSMAPNVALGADGRVYLSWVEPAANGHALRFATWDGTGWSAPGVAAEGGPWFVNWADVPSVAALADGTLAAHWLAKSAAATYAYDVWLSVSRDGGATWSPPIRAHDDGTPTEHGFASLVPAGDAFDVVWLDGRGMADEPPGPMTLRHARLDPDGTVTPAAVVDDRVCDCCPTAAVRTNDALLVLYRDRSADEIRDIWRSRLEGGVWSAPVAVWDDEWQTGGCPVNGPALDAAGSSVAAAWFTLEHARDAMVRVAFSPDGGRTFGAPTRVDAGAPIGRVDIVLLPDGAARVAWMEDVGDGAAIRLRDVRPDGTATRPRTAVLTSVARSSGYPKLAWIDGTTLLAWTEVSGETTRVRTGRLP